MAVKIFITLAPGQTLQVILAEQNKFYKIDTSSSGLKQWTFTFPETMGSDGKFGSGSSKRPLLLSGSAKRGGGNFKKLFKYPLNARQKRQLKKVLNVKPKSLMKQYLIKHEIVFQNSNSNFFGFVFETVSMVDRSPFLCLPLCCYLVTPTFL